MDVCCPLPADAPATCPTCWRLLYGQVCTHCFPPGAGEEIIPPDADPAGARAEPASLAKAVPRPHLTAGTKVWTPGGPGEVVSCFAVSDRVHVLLSASGRAATFSLAEVSTEEGGR